MYQRLLVPLDGSAIARRGLSEAIALAADQHATLCLFHAVDDFPLLMEMSSVVSFEDMRTALRQQGEKLLAEAADSARKAGVATESLLREVTHTRIGEVILEAADQCHCDLIVMGSHGRRGFHRLAMGSVADVVLRASRLPVLLLRGADPALS
jgi:nucleotide-binding universal stress UspA family protein